MQTNGTNLNTGENESMVLEEEIDENYEPTQEEILEYSRYIGIDPETDKDLLYLAKEGLKAPLPEDWKPCQNREGKIYYFNFKTKQSQWEHPCDEYYKKLCQEMKRKKEEKPTKTGGSTKEKTETRGAFNMPFAKQETIPVKNILASQHSHQQSLEASFSADNQLFTMNHKMSFSNDNPEYNSITDKKFDGKVLPADLESFQSLGDENILAHHEEIKEENMDEYKKQNQSEIDKFVRSCREAESKLERQLKQKMERELEELKNELSSNSRLEDFTAIIKEKEGIKSNMRSEYKKKTETAIQKLDKDYANKKREIGAAESKNLRENVHFDEEKIKGEFEAKQAALVAEKKKLEIEKEKLRVKEQNSKLKLEEQLEKEKKEVITDYTSLLREVEAEELQSQKQEIHNYCLELQDRLADEKQTLINARKQKASINMTRKNELDELYSRRLKLEQERIENEMAKVIREYEENQKRKKDDEIVRLQNLELTHERERYQMRLQEEVDQLKTTYNERLTNYQRLLKDKLKKEKITLEKVNAKIIEEYQRSADNIKVNVNTRDEIFNQISRAQTMVHKETNRELAELEEKIETQVEENRELQERVSVLKQEEKERQESANRAIEEIKKKIKDAETQIQKLIQKKERRNEMPRQKPRLVPVVHKLNSKSIGNLGAIKKDLKDIKSFLTKRESVPRPSKREGYDSGRASITSRRESSPKRTSVSRYENYGDHYTHRPSLKYDNFFAGNKDWSHILVEEENRIQDQKYNLEVEKRNLRKNHDVLTTEREMYKQEHPPILSMDSQESESYRKDVRKRKDGLNTQIYSLNRSIAKLREDQALIKTKEKSFHYLKKAVEQFENAEIGSGELEAIYNNYQETNLPTKVNGEQRSKSSYDKENRGAVLSNRESKRFFEKWRNSLNPEHSGESDLESERTVNERVSATRRTYGKENVRGGNSFREKTHRQRPSSSQPDGQGEYSYNSLINVLEMKTKHESRYGNSSFVQLETTGVNETRTQATKVFSQHSQWLKDVKDQLNKHLYERPGKSTALFMK